MELKRSSVVTDGRPLISTLALRDMNCNLGEQCLMQSSYSTELMVPRTDPLFTRSKIKVYLRFEGLSVLVTSANTFERIFNSKLIVFL